MFEPMTIWERLSLCVGELAEPFRAAEIVDWFRQHHPDVNEQSLRTHIQSATSNVPATSKVAGFANRRPLVTRVGRGVYVRYAGEQEAERRVEDSRRSASEPADIVLIACSDDKARSPVPARDLYLGTAFRKAVAYAEARDRFWYVLSGKWGLLRPDEVVAPYNLYLPDQPVAYRRAWGSWVAAQLELAEGSVRQRIVEFHAGQSYVEPLREPLTRLGGLMREPLRGRRQGEQLAWYGTLDSTAATVDTSSVEAEAPGSQIAYEGLKVLWGPAPTGAFEYRWPDSTEAFDTSWELAVEAEGRTYTVRHCLGSREVYGRQRRHSVTFVNRAPEVEGVAADDYPQGRGLISPLKGPDRKLVRHIVDVPEAYRSFALVDHRIAIVAPYSRDAVAAKLAEDDVLGWASYAVARQAVRLAGAQEQPDLPVPETVGPIMPPPAAPGTGRREDVVAALLVLGRSGLEDEWVGPSSFTPNAPANELLVDDAFAFLLGVVFDQGIPAERAWQAPYELQLRLGHLDPMRMAHEGDEIRRAIGTAPKLHRFVEKMPTWVWEAAKRVAVHYGGDAARIWGGEPTARELAQRLDAFPGIGQKKAAMAVEILERDLGVPIRDMHGSDVAYDVHVRRVFLRTRLAEIDDLDHMVDVARSANPDRPGEIDLPAWHVGRTWCRAGVPLCDSCPLAAVCPKDIAAASKVRGV